MPSFLRSETVPQVVRTAIVVTGDAAESVARLASTVVVAIVLSPLRPAVFPVSASPLLSSVTSSINTNRPILVSPVPVLAQAEHTSKKTSDLCRILQIIPGGSTPWRISDQDGKSAIVHRAKCVFGGGLVS